MQGGNRTMNNNGLAADSFAETDRFEPFVAPHEHLRELLVRHNTLLKRLVARTKRSKTDALGFVAVSEQEVQHLLDAPPFVDGVAPPPAPDAAGRARKCLARSTVLRQPMLRRERASHFSVSLRPAPCR